MFHNEVITFNKYVPKMIFIISYLQLDFSV